MLELESAMLEPAMLESVMLNQDRPRVDSESIQDPSKIDLGSTLDRSAADPGSFHDRSKEPQKPPKSPFMYERMTKCPHSELAICRPLWELLSRNHQFPIPPHGLQERRSISLAFPWQPCIPLAPSPPAPLLSFGRHVWLW